MKKKKAEETQPHKQGGFSSPLAIGLWTSDVNHGDNMETHSRLKIDHQAFIYAELHIASLGWSLHLCSNQQSLIQKLKRVQGKERVTQRDTPAKLVPLDAVKWQASPI